MGMKHVDADELDQEPAPYHGLEPDELILRDRLAASRTDLANERTLLAYVRTALALFAAGVTFVHFFDWLWLDVIGWAFVPIGIATLALGFSRFRKIKGRIRRIQNGPE